MVHNRNHEICEIFGGSNPKKDWIQHCHASKNLATQLLFQEINLDAYICHGNHVKNGTLSVTSNDGKIIILGRTTR